MSSYPKGTRKITVDSQTWRWYDAGGYHTIIWNPQGEKQVVHKSNFTIGSCGWQSQWNKEPTMPADIRRFIDVHILKRDVAFKLDAKAIPGKLYAYREKHIDSGPSVSIYNTWGGGISDGYQRWTKVRKHLAEQKPFIFLKGYIDQKEKNAYYEILVEDIVATILIPYPRTWSGSFKETTLEWQNEKAS